MDALVTPISFLLIIIVGYLFKRAGRFKDRDYRIVQRIVFGITIPCVIINSFVGSEHDASLLWITLFSFACSFIPLIIMYAVTWRKPVEERAFEMLNVTGFNTGNFCLPVVQSYYGPGAVIVAVMFDIGNSATISSFMNVFTTSTLHISPDRPLSEQAHEKGMTTLPYTPPTDAHARRLEHRAKLRRALKSLFSSVPFDIYIVMIVLMLMHIELPQWLADICAPGGERQRLLLHAHGGHAHGAAHLLGRGENREPCDRMASRARSNLRRGGMVSAAIRRADAQDRDDDVPVALHGVRHAVHRPCAGQCAAGGIHTVGDGDHLAHLHQPGVRAGLAQQLLDGGDDGADGLATMRDRVLLLRRHIRGGQRFDEAPGAVGLVVGNE